VSGQGPRSPLLDILAPAGRAALPRAHARGMPKRGASDTLAGQAGGGPAAGRRLGREPRVTILLMYERLWPDPG